MGSCLGRTRRSKRTYLQTRSLEFAVGKAQRTTMKIVDQLHRDIYPGLPLWVARGMPESRPDLSYKDRRVVVESWIYLRTSMPKIGKLMFMHIFHAVPRVKEIFKANTQKAEVRDNLEQMAACHAEHVLVSVDKLVKVLDDDSKIDFFCHDLGDLHATYDVRLEYLDLFVPFFIATIHPALHIKWATSIEETWSSFFKLILYLMKESIAFY